MAMMTENVTGDWARSEVRSTAGGQTVCRFSIATVITHRGDGDDLVRPQKRLEPVALRRDPRQREEDQADERERCRRGDDGETLRREAVGLSVKIEMRGDLIGKAVVQRRADDGRYDDERDR